MRRRPWWPVALIVAVAASLLPALERGNLLAYDLLAPSRTPGDALVIVAADEASIAELGRWPWSRETHARLLDRLREGGAAVVGFAVLFSEPSADPQADEVLASALAAYGRAVLPVAPVDALEVAPDAMDGGVLELRPLESFVSSVRLAHADMEIDVDGVVRRLHLQGGTRSLLPALSLALVEGADPSFARRPLPGLRMAKRGSAPPGSWRRDNEVMLPHRAGAPTIWSYEQALSSPQFLEAVRGRAVLVGATARGIGPELPLAGRGEHSVQPVVLAHAHAFDSIAARALLTPASKPVAASLTLLLLGGMLAFVPVRAGRTQQVALVAALLAPMAVSWLLLRGLSVWWGPLPATLALLGGVAAWFAMHLSDSLQRVRRAHRNAAATLDSIGDAVFSVDEDGRIVYLNSQARALARVPDPVGLTIGEAFEFDAESGLKLVAMVESCQARRQPVRDRSHLALAQPGERERLLAASIVPLHAAGGSPESAVVALTDQTDSIASARQLSHAASHDQLTGLPNRGLLRDRVAQELARSLGDSQGPAILFVDLNRFKRINEGLGHRMGDEVLRITAQRLVALGTPGDSVGRWAGNEFVVMLARPQGRRQIANHAVQVVESLSLPFSLDGVEVSCSSSVGIAMAPADGSDVDELFAKAEAAMHRAKVGTGVRYEFYADATGRWTRDRLAMELKLGQALHKREFELVYQPQMRASDEQLVGFEALLRWRRSDVLVAPSEFLGLADEAGLMTELGAYVLEEAAREIAHWQRVGLEPMPVSVNVSARQFQGRIIVEQVQQVLSSHAIPPALLTLEITEHTAVADPDLAVALVAELAEMGVRTSIDDFGTGYSSLSMLRRIPIAEIKIDRSFVADMHRNPDDGAIVRATIALAHELGLKVVAEGVELREQFELLAKLGCDYVQGFLFDPPVSADEARRMLPWRRAANLQRPQGIDRDPDAKPETNG